MGYDGVELPMFDLDVDKYASWGKRLDDLGLERTAVTVRGEAGQSDQSRSAGAGRRAWPTTNACSIAARRPAATLVGPYHSALGIFTGEGPTEDEWKWGVESMRQVAEYAGKAGVTLGVECLNRFECYLLNTPADAGPVRPGGRPSAAAG